MRRRLFTLGSAVSLLLCVSVTVTWVRSYSVGDTFRWYDRQSGRDDYIVSGRGQLMVFLERFRPQSGGVGLIKSNGHTRWSDPPGLGWWVTRLKQRRGTEAYAPILGVGFFRHAPDESGKYDVAVIVPYWVWFALTAAAPAAWAYGFRLRLIAARRKRGLCPNCGYDLRATPDRCPECGTPAAKGK